MVVTWTISSTVVVREADVTLRLGWPPKHIIAQSANSEAVSSGAELVGLRRARQGYLIAIQGTRALCGSAGNIWMMDMTAIRDAD
jgi:hypothetical protein